MTKQKLTLLSVCAFLLSTFVSCGNILTQPTDSTSNSGTVNSGDFTDKVINALVYNCDDHEDSDDYSWNTSSVIPITLNGSSINVTGSGATVSGTKVTVTSTGNYSISGTLSDGQIIVNTEDEGTVRLILNGANITSSTSAPIHIISAKKVVLVLADTTQNYVTDASSYSSSTEEDAPNATIFSMSDLTIFGNGILTVDANYNDGIASKDGLIIKSGTININSVDDGIRGKDYLIVKNGNITVKSGGDGLKSDNEDDSSKGYISIEAGTLNITSGGDAIAAETDVLISNGTISLTSGGGSGYAVGTISTKGIKAIVNTIIDDGTITINSADDALHSNGCLVINGGTFSISSGDDGVHADSILGINGGDILIKKSYEGIESAAIIITDGTIHVTSSDDGINAAGGNDGSSVNGRPGQNQFATTGNYYLSIKGGYIAVSAVGDGVDINGAIAMTGGTLFINGPTNNGNGAIDYDSSFKITGGLLMAAGSSGMAQAPGTTSTQYSVLVNFNSARSAGTLVNIQASDGTGIVTFKPTKSYQSIAFSSPALTKSTTYNVYTGGSSTGTPVDGLYEDGVYTAGTKYTSFTINSVVTTIR